MYRLRPKIEIDSDIKIYEGYEHIIERIKIEYQNQKPLKVAVEAYPSLDTDKVIQNLKKQLPEAVVLDTDDYFMSAESIYHIIEDDLTKDEVFGRFSHNKFSDFLDLEKLKELNQKLKTNKEFIILVGVLASKIIEFDLLVYLDINRWEIQKNYKEGLGNWKAFKETSFNEKLKRAYYFEWPAATEIKNDLLSECDYYVDMNQLDHPKMMSGEDLLLSLQEASTQPFRLVPFFEPGIWGGNWMQEQFNVGKDEINLAWCFDGVPEENSILLATENNEIEMPAQNLVLLYPIGLLGEKVFGRFGKDFPIRFNFLDTVGGQNLSLQVHPTLDYAYRNFGAKYTQDESYYIMDSNENAKIYLGVKNDVDQETLIEAFEQAAEIGKFDHDKYIYSQSVKKHDHYLIPGGTIHSSGEGALVLEISSTPNRFTFKLWDWGRVDLDGKPRPISLHHGRHVINTEINEEFVSRELYNVFQIIKKEEHFIEEHTGLHKREPIETRRITFTDQVLQSTENSVNVLNLVEGDHIKILPKDNFFKSFDVYYGETFIIPEQVKDYYLVPAGDDTEIKVVKAFIR